MTRPVIPRSVVIALCMLFSIAVAAQPASKDNKPYRILTSGKQITVKSTKNIKNIMVWTASGHRIVEQRDLNLSSFSFNANVKEKVFFIMIQYEGLKPYTEKIGLRD